MQVTPDDLENTAVILVFVDPTSPAALDGLERLQDVTAEAGVRCCSFFPEVESNRIWRCTCLMTPGRIDVIRQPMAACSMSLRPDIAASMMQMSENHSHGTEPHHTSHSLLRSSTNGAEEREPGYA